MPLFLDVFSWYPAKKALRDDTVPRWVKQLPYNDLHILIPFAKVPQSDLVEVV